MDKNLNVRARAQAEVRILHPGDRLPAEDCPHPATMLYTWFVDALVDSFTGQYLEDDGLYPPDKILCAVCCQCGTIVKGEDKGD